MLDKAVQYDGTYTVIYCTILEAELHQNIRMAFLDSNIRMYVNQTINQAIFKPYSNHTTNHFQTIVKPYYEPFSNHNTNHTMNHFQTIIQTIFKPYSNHTVRCQSRTHAIRGWAGIRDWHGKPCQSRIRGWHGLFSASRGPSPSADGPGHPRIIHLRQNRLLCIAKTAS